MKGSGQDMKTRKGYTTYPLTVSQKFHNYYAGATEHKEILNIGTTLTIEFELDVDELRNAVYKAYQRSEFMRVRFAYDKTEDEWYQYVVSEDDMGFSPEDIEYVDFSSQTMEYADEVMTKWTRTPFVQEDSQMNKVVIIKNPDGFQGIFLMGDHRLIDAQSLIVFMKDVIELYCSKMFEGVPYPSEMTSYIKQLEKDIAYENNSKQQQKDREYFYKLIDESEPIFNGIEGTARLDETRKVFKDKSLRYAVGASDSIVAAIDTFSLEADATEQLMKFCEEQHISLQVLLIMGIRTYFQKFNNNDDVSMQVSYARRATLMEKKSGGTRIHCFPFRTVIPRDMSFLDALKVIRTGQNETFRHVNLNPVEYMGYRAKKYKVNPGCTYESISLTYQPATLKQNGLGKNIEGINYKTKRYGNGVYSDGIYLSVMHRPDDNGLDFLFEHQIKAYTTPMIEYFYYYLCKIMFKGIERPNLTVGEIIDLV